ncbi:MAG: hypothetical protein IIA45_09075 [Bacteroidetes bacterium]|nr:hypothetical protein [Bacteroidota bacterium]
MNRQTITNLNFILILLFVTLGSCSKKQNIAHQLKGSWNVDEYELEEYVDGELKNNEVRYNEGTLTFSEDGTGTSSGFNFVSGQTSFTWSNTSATLTITAGGSTIEYDIIENSNTSFIFRLTTIVNTNEKDIETWTLSPN